MAASAEQNEIIELTDLIEKGPDLPKNSPKTPEPLPLPDEAPAQAAPASDDLLLLPVQDHGPEPSPAPAAGAVPPAREWEAQLDASAAVIGDTGLHLAALAAQTGTESPLLPESLERISSLEESCRQLDRRLTALESQTGNGHGDATLLMETVERLTRLEEQVQALLRQQGAPAAPEEAPAAADNEHMARLEEERQVLAQRVEALEHQLGDLMTDFDKYVEKAAAAAAARILHEEIRRLMADQA